MNRYGLWLTLVFLISAAVRSSQAELELKLTEREWNTQYVYKVASDRDAGVPESQAQSAFAALVETLPEPESRDSAIANFVRREIEFIYVDRASKPADLANAAALECASRHGYVNPRRTFSCKSISNGFRLFQQSRNRIGHFFITGRIGMNRI